MEGSRDEIWETDTLNLVRCCVWRKTRSSAVMQCFVSYFVNSLKVITFGMTKVEW